MGQTVTVTFHTEGSPVDPIKLCKGATLASVLVGKMPVSQRDGYIFAGWKTEDESPDLSFTICTNSAGFVTEVRKAVFILQTSQFIKMK